ncbi:YceH family protein [Pseudomonas sp. Marseille-Q8238]
MSNDLDAQTELDPLSAIEVRVLGCLIEKQATTPETYPLTVNATVLACNQKTSREPLMSLTEGQVGQALRSLEGRGLSRLVMGGRADRWEQRAEKTLELVKPQLALIGLLLLRGPQTINELLTRSNRLFAFEDAAEVQHQLERLAVRGLASLLPRQAGQREERYMHLLGEPADLEALLASRGSTESAPRAVADESRLAELEARIVALEERLALLEGRE